jgi:hypothetical protein
MSMTIAAIDKDFEAGIGLSDSMVFERRCSTRVRISRPIRVIDLIIGRHAAGRSRDVSSTGMKVEIPATNGIQEGDTIQVDVGTLAGVGPLFGRPRVIPARVVWIRRESKMLRPMLTAGVEFELDFDAMINVA